MKGEGSPEPLIAFISIISSNHTKIKTEKKPNKAEMQGMVIFLVRGQFTMLRS